ncbi:Anti-sigma-K factor RskA [Granulicella rosea]|uniref:Anti-sigma-K factor RskA n=1 Tax=Granulicella rosea TaxID=474952 RepID=A0A239IW72_9BACT|nr:anti-sigma factor [Granulicella rosea]SNS97632.1 Anti-sigma-K factor RskA [Granulicella rosea]
MIPVKHIDPEDLPLYAMQLLSPEETAEITLHLQHSAEARRVLAEIQGDLAALAHTAEMHSPPALARQRLMKHVAREKKPVPIDRFAPVATYAPRESTLLDDEPVKKSAAARVLPWVGWAVAAGLAVEASSLYQQRQSLRTTVTSQSTQLAKLSTDAELSKNVLEAIQDPSAVRFSLTATGAKAPPEGRAAYLADKGSLVFIASNLEPLEPYKTYELWLVPADNHDPIPAGIFKPDIHGSATVVLPTLPKGVQAKAFAVSIEQDGGTSAPTKGAVVLQGLAT